MTADVAICARPGESIYRLIYSVIIRSAIARAPGDGKDNHVNEIPNVSIVAGPACERRENTPGNTTAGASWTSSSKRIP